jgi:hypothetical protein
MLMMPSLSTCPETPDPPMQSKPLKNKMNLTDGSQILHSAIKVVWHGNSYAPNAPLSKIRVPDNFRYPNPEEDKDIPNYHIKILETSPTCNDFIARYKSALQEITWWIRELSTDENQPLHHKKWHQRKD